MNEFSNLTSWAATNVDAVVFYLLAVMAIPLAFGVILDRAIIRSGFILIGVFCAISGLFFVLQAQFLAMAQLMIYAVGITLVVVIALMLTNPRLEKDQSPVVLVHKAPGLFVAILLFVTINMASRSEPWAVSNEAVQSENVKVLGSSLMTFYSLPFEFASVLLLAALVGAVMLAKAERGKAVDETESVKGKTNNQTAKRTNDVVKA